MHLEVSTVLFHCSRRPIVYKFYNNMVGLYIALYALTIPIYPAHWNHLKGYYIKYLLIAHNKFTLF